MSFNFNCGDGKTKNLPGTVPVALHTYRKPGTYEVSLEIIDNYGNIHISKRSIRVLERKS
ncbi:MAG: PKD domain-containing protein [Promethearchaeota archaeon]